MAQIYWPFDPKLVIEWPGKSSLAIRPNHFGTDIGVPHGTPLRATTSGTIDIHWDDGLGTWVIDIIAPDGTVVRNGHMSYMAVADDEWADAGDYIGNTGGNPGTPGAGLSTGGHLHWEIRNNREWGDSGWYDPRDLVIHSFAELDGGSAFAKPTIHGMGSEMIVFYAHALGKGKPGWLVLGFTPNALIVSTQTAANAWSAHIGKPTIKTEYTGFRTYLRAAGGTVAQLARVSKG